MEIDQSIVARKTVKVLADQPLASVDVRDSIQELVDLAGWAPFHRPCDPVHHKTQASLDGIVPWRMHLFDAENCRRLRNILPAERAGKIPAMLASALGMIYTTWLPNTPTDSDSTHLFEPTLANMEHIAAASAAIQNLLLAATSRGFDNYWSSGGALLREPEITPRLGIDSQEILLGAVFLFPGVDQTPPSVTRAESKLRHQRPASDRWSRWVTI